MAAGLVVLLVLPSAADSSSAVATATLTGKLTGLPAENGISVSVEAISLDDDSVGASEVARGSRYSLSVPPGPYLVVGSALDPQHHRTKTAYKAVQVGPSGHADLALTMRKLSSAASAAASTSAASPVVAIGNIKITGPEGLLPGVAQGGLISGLLPACHAAGSKVIDRSAAVDAAIAQERKLAQQGQLDVKFQFNPLTPDYEVSGEISVGPGGGPLADLTVTDTKTGKAVQHIRAGGDPADWLDISHWETLIGAGVGKKLTNHSNCGVPSKQTTTTAAAGTTKSTTTPTPAGTCDPGNGSVCVVYDGSMNGETDSPNLTAIHTTENVSWHLVWISKPAGYGVPNTFDAAHSWAKGTGTVKFHAGTVSSSSQATCSSPFELNLSTGPSLTQGTPFSKTEVTINIPNPTEDSAGGGTGPPVIDPTNPSCSPLVGSQPYTFTFKDVPLRPGTYVLPANMPDGKISGPGKSGTFTLTGTITVVVG